MTARAVVTGSRADGSVDVEIDVSERCEGCAGVCMWRFLPSRHRARIAAGHAIAPGSKVRLSVPQRYVLLSSALLYGLPLAALLLGALAGSMVTGGDLGALLGALAFAGLALRLASGLRRRLERATLAHLKLERLT